MPLPDAGSQSKRDLDILRRCVEIAGRGDNEALVINDERPVELRQFFDRAAQVRIADVPGGQRVKRDRIENQRTRLIENRVGRSERE